MTSKRGNNEGSITHRADGRWMARVTLEDGTRKNFYAKTRQEASRLLAGALRDRDAGLPIVGEKQTVEQYLGQWLNDIKPTIRHRSWIRYEEMVRLHVLPTVGAVALSRLSPQQVQALYTAKLSQGLAPATVARIHAVLRRAFGEATRMGVIQRNVVALVRPPRPMRKEMQVFTAEQARTFLTAIVDDPLEALYVLALTTGMRRGEMLALHWADVDLDSGFVQVRFTVQHIAGAQVIYSAPKTSRSRRKVALSQRAIAVLQKHRQRQEEQRARVSVAWVESDLVFTNAVGQQMRGNHILQRHFTPVLQRAGLPLIRFHDLRHTAATLLLTQGIHPKIVSEMLGHSTVSMTLDTYSHVLPDMQRDATAAFDRLFGDDR
jgi:integrase